MKKVKQPRAPKVEFCEVMIEAIDAALKAGSIADYYALTAPEMVQVGIEAPAQMPTGESAIGAGFLRAAINEQRRFIERMGGLRRKWRDDKAKEQEENSARAPKEFRENSATSVSVSVTDTATLSQDKSCSCVVAAEPPTAHTPTSKDDEGLERTGHEPKQKRTAKDKARPKDAAEVAAYAEEIGYNLDAERFMDYYEAQGWKQGNGQPIKDWKAAVRNWQRRDRERGEEAAPDPSESRIKDFKLP